MLPQASGLPEASTDVTATTLVRSAPSSNPSFDEVYNSRYEPMLRLASGLVDALTDAEDIVQESFNKLWQRWESVTMPGSYLRTSVVNGCHNELRRRRVRRASGHLLIHGQDPECEYLADALAAIPEPRRRAVVLRYYGDRTMTEIAEAMEIPTGTAKSLIHRGLADLRGVFN
jgi:DNA-directed RNA polymerase specialized sigma24 family protein